MAGLSFRLIGADKEFEKLDRETKKEINSIARTQAFDTMNKVKQNTPIDTGRARNSWILTTEKNKFKDAKNGSNLPSFLPPVDDRKIETLYLTNGTPYIENLNQGSSKQAPARFIETAILGTYTIDGVLFETINKDDGNRI